MSKYFIETYGCPMNVAESQALAQSLEEGGHTKASAPNEADWIIVNTCSVRQSAEDRVYGRLGFFKSIRTEINPDLKVAVMGCMAAKKEAKEQLMKAPFHVNAVLPHDQRDDLIKMMSDQITDEVPKFSFYTYHPSDDGIHAYVPIMHGCNNYCTFCIIPYLRGKEISRPKEEIAQELQRHVDQGVKEITLLGQNVNSYQDGEVDFPALIRYLSAQVKGKVWFRFTSSHPKDFNLDLIDALKSDARFCPHLHVAVQHGSDRILREMARETRRDKFEALVREVRAQWPQAALITDLMVGFPSESEEDMQALFAMLDTVQFEDAFMYYYNTRPGTPAAKRTDVVPEAIKSLRLQQLIDKQRAISHQILRKQIGQEREVLLISPAKKTENGFLGRTQRNENVIVVGKQFNVGDFVHVQLRDINGQTLLCDVL
ncbi:tRNA (N6-isopentenyl adenosine(37)-C2)-methylthiotransferase MiaB [Entomospira culicis]|uniref:tRNA-2-methylthio-N(6)-dimethylallyladenosine synthase n=1 Tax=Entomospira culicis TaxID=2719989 RepID=A0A968GFY3_9SPIO|nr:tRNA (N6-isopentenyl adenosine(37)-C2)-methylthiotransferase MiaB [Entomospira culicis]NIZ18876.1 tRNA (N6-isopentenyl adenosine(37)-C2)-methylthiotransferase MiaB [Entomospira culicis]NIZ69091.1 tRNA (N6-isopentenyl adenosine(37)-C2)-methylthiotransferase MiaB [Entomospira culicis]WDI37678.1 tRNA (N6-isopentenyl adenosine(37)-C2)-methylthiotransferase MiaB [Entomospira culicis]WDI39306.1 tRNA (N6-isopentenyl adenosine(37)-C2)-methylthiotransferase MiaB [Entomospira culicis]